MQIKQFLRNTFLLFVTDALHAVSQSLFEFFSVVIENSLIIVIIVIVIIVIVVCLLLLLFLFFFLFLFYYYCYYY